MFNRKLLKVILDHSDSEFIHRLEISRKYYFINRCANNQYSQITPELICKLDDLDRTIEYMDVIERIQFDSTIHKSYVEYSKNHNLGEYSYQYDEGLYIKDTSESVPRYYTTEYLNQMANEDLNFKEYHCSAHCKDIEKFIKDFNLARNLRLKKLLNNNNNNNNNNEELNP